MIRRPPKSTRTEHSFPTRRSSDLAPSTSGNGKMEWGCTAAARNGQPRATDTRSARPAGDRLLLGRCRLQLHAWLERVERMLFLSHAAVADREGVLRRQSRDRKSKRLNSSH